MSTLTKSNCRGGEAGAAPGPEDGVGGVVCLWDAGGGDEGRGNEVLPPVKHSASCRRLQVAGEELMGVNALVEAGGRDFANDNTAGPASRFESCAATAASLRGGVQKVAPALSSASLCNSDLALASGLC